MRCPWALTSLAIGSLVLACGSGRLHSGQSTDGGPWLGGAGGGVGGSSVTGQGGGVGGSSVGGQGGGGACTKIECFIDFPCDSSDKASCVAGDPSKIRFPYTVGCETACHTPCCSGGGCDLRESTCSVDEVCAYPGAQDGTTSTDAECIDRLLACGGPDDEQCPSGQYCERFGSFCSYGRCSDSVTPCDYSNGGGFGTCRPLPGDGDCGDEPVCGCDGKTYASDCERKKASVAWLHNGTCEAGMP